MLLTIANQNVFRYNLVPRDAKVYMYLASCSNRKDTYFPAIKTIAKACNLAVSTIKRALSSLLEIGLLHRTLRFRDVHGGQTSNLYTLTTPMEQMEMETGGSVPGVERKARGVARSEHR